MVVATPNFTYGNRKMKNNLLKKILLFTRIIDHNDGQPCYILTGSCHRVLCHENAHGDGHLGWKYSLIASYEIG
jgi:hypothetical protein